MKLFPTITADHWRKAIARKKTERNPAQEQVNAKLAEIKKRRAA